MIFFRREGDVVSFTSNFYGVISISLLVFKVLPLLLRRLLSFCVVIGFCFSYFSFQVAFVFSEPSSSSAMFSAFCRLRRAFGVDFVWCLFVLCVAQASFFLA